MRKLLVLGLLIAAVSATLAARSSPAVAFRFSGTAYLPFFPCVPGGCVGNFSGTARGQLENTGPNGSGPMNATFTYQESNCNSGNGIMDGTINGIDFFGGYIRTERIVRLTGTYGSHPLNAILTLPVTLLSSGCMSGGAPGPAAGNMSGAARG